MNKILALTSLLLFVRVNDVLAQSPQNTDDPVTQFDAYVEQAVRDWRVPGLTVTVVKDGKVLFKKGYGYRVLPGNRSATAEPVNTQTLFAMASTTKAMTAACLGMLVDEGKLRWDDPVTNYLPDFQLYDPAVTREVRVRDLLIHDTGVGNADFLWAAHQLSSEEILHHLRLIKPSYSFRSGFIYQNIMYLAAGKVIEKVSGKPWDVFIRTRIFEPLNMRWTKALFRDVTDPNRAKPHIEIKDTIRLIDSREEEGLVDAVNAAGSVWSCADDLANWMQCMLDSGRYRDGGGAAFRDAASRDAASRGAASRGAASRPAFKALVKPATWAELFKPQTIVTDNEFYPTQVLTKPVWKTYGLGWFQHDYRGQRVNFHTGSLTGMVAIHGQLPAHKLAVYVQGNLDHAELRHALMYRAFDAFALGIDRDWSAEFQKLYGAIRQRAKTAERKADSTRVLNTKPSLPLTAYLGRYTDPLFGQAVVTMQNGVPHLSLNNRLTGPLNHWHFDTFRLPYDQFWNGTDLVSFTLAPAGKVQKLIWNGAEFTREPDHPGKGVAER